MHDRKSMACIRWDCVTDVSLLFKRTLCVHSTQINLLHTAFGWLVSERCQWPKWKSYKRHAKRNSIIILVLKIRHEVVLAMEYNGRPTARHRHTYTWLCIPVDMNDECFHRTSDRQPSSIFHFPMTNTEWMWQSHWTTVDPYSSHLYNLFDCNPIIILNNNPTEPMSIQYRNYWTKEFRILYKWNEKEETKLCRMWNVFPKSANGCGGTIADLHHSDQLRSNFDLV